MGSLKVNKKAEIEVLRLDFGSSWVDTEWGWFDASNSIGNGQ